MSIQSGISKSLRSKKQFYNEEDDDIIQNRSILSNTKKSKFQDIDQLSDIDQVGGQKSEQKYKFSKQQDDIQSQRKLNQSNQSGVHSKYSQNSAGYNQINTNLRSQKGEHLKKAKEDVENWGAQNIFHTNIIQNSFLGESKPNFEQTGQYRDQVVEVRKRLFQVAYADFKPPECFIAQMAFTSHNAFLLTTCGRLFSWGAKQQSLGRHIQSNEQNNGNYYKSNMKNIDDSYAGVGEIEFGSEITITKIASGKHHMLALDSNGRVWSWGKNDKCQLGHNNQINEHCLLPEKVEKIKDIVQIYCGEYMSFSVDKYGEVNAWGINKNNCLLVNNLKEGLVKQIVEYPTPIKLPDYFPKSQSINIVQNNGLGMDFYDTNRPIQSEDTKQKIELNLLREENSKLRKKLKDFQKKLLKAQSHQNESQNPAQNSGEDGVHLNHITKICNNDKVIQSIKQLYDKTENDLKLLKENQTSNEKKYNDVCTDVKQLDNQLQELEKNEIESKKEMDDFLQKEEQKVNNSGSEKDKQNLKELTKSKKKEQQDIKLVTQARKTNLVSQLSQKKQQQFELKQKLIVCKTETENATENQKIYYEVMHERRRFLMSQYLMKGEEDFEQILESLHDHFKLIQLTSFENLARNNSDNLTAKRLIELSNLELNQLSKTLDLMKMDEEDVRYEVFLMIFDMLLDNIKLRKNENKLLQRLLVQGELNLDKAVTQYFRKVHDGLSDILEQKSQKLQQKIQQNKPLFGGVFMGQVVENEEYDEDSDYQQNKLDNSNIDNDWAEDDSDDHYQHKSQISSQRRR